MSTLELVYTISVSVVVGGLSIFCIIMFIRNAWFKKIKDALDEAIAYAEHNIKGASEKFIYVTKKIEFECIDIGIPYVLIKRVISKYVNKVIKHYNVINHNGK